MQFKRRLVGRQGCLLSMFLHDYRWQRHLADKKIVVLCALYIKQTKNIMKHQLYTIALGKNCNDSLNGFFEINCFFNDPCRILQLSKFVWTLRSSVSAVFNNFLLIDATTI